MVGKSYGQDIYEVEATFQNASGETQTVAAPVYVTVGHIYTISGES